MTIWKEEEDIVGSRYIDTPCTVRTYLIVLFPLFFFFAAMPPYTQTDRLVTAAEINNNDDDDDVVVVGSGKKGFHYPFTWTQISQV